MHLINKVYLVAPLGRRVLNVIEQFAGIFYFGSRSSVDFDQVDKTAFIDGLATIALTAGCRGNSLIPAPISGTVKAFRQNARQRGFADATRASKQVSVV